MISDVRTAEFGGVATDKHEGTVAVQARCYAHPCLPERTIVRLVRENLTEVEDLSLGALGFPAAETSSKVGYLRTQAVGFPAWPIIHDPKNARHALNLVQDLRRAARIARTRPGPAKDMIDELASTLGSSAPHFLPTFLEEVARLFQAQDNFPYAAQFFTRAREAERVHNLAVDESRHRQVFLEFALSGALSAKALTNESKALLERTSPEEAIALFTRLNVDRVKGGLPPYANLHADLRRLIKACGADQAMVEETFLSAILDLPAIDRAPGGFWKGYLPALARLSRRTPAIRESLVRALPLHADVESWVSVLEKVGIADEFRAGTRDATEWVTEVTVELQSRYGEPYPRTFAALVRQCPTLSGKTITLDYDTSQLSVEVVDALLAAGMAITFGQPSRWSNGHFFSLGDWAKQTERGDLAHFTANPELSAMVTDIGSVLSADGVQALLTNPGLKALLQRWASSRLNPESTLPQVTDELARLAPLLNPASYQVAPGGLDALFGLDGAELLASQLRHGLLTELTWPALEAAAERLTAANCDPTAPLPPPEITTHESWPAVGVACCGQVAFIDGDQVLAESTFSHGVDPQEWNYFLVDDVIGCCSLISPFESELTWSNDPARRHPQGYQSLWADRHSFAVPGGRLVSVGLQRAGDAKALFMAGDNLLHEDGHFWTYSDGWRELDPATGQQGRESLPPKLAALVEDQLRAGYEVSRELTTWCPATATTAGSLLSTVDGWHGWVMLTASNGEQIAVGGGQVLGDAHDLAGQLTRPGGGHWQLTQNGRLRLPGGGQLEWTRDQFGEPHLLHEVPVAGWHQFRVRNEQVSARLRTITADAVAALYAAAPIAPEPGDAEGSVTLTDEVRELAGDLLASTDPALVDAACWLAARTKRVVQEIDAAQKKCAGGVIGTFAQWPTADDVLAWRDRWPGLSDRRSILALGLLARGEPAHPELLSTNIIVAVCHPEALLALAACPLQPDAAIRGAAATVGAVLDGGLYTETTTAFQVACDWTKLEPVLPTSTGPALLLDKVHRDGSAFGVSPGGAVPAKVQGFPSKKVLASSGIEPGSIVDAFEKLLVDGPPDWDPSWAEQFARGTGWSVPAAKVFLSGLQGLTDWDHNYLPKQLRTLLGLKVAEATSAREFLTKLDAYLLVELYAAGAHDPVGLVTEGPDIAAMIALWQERQANQIQIPEEVLVDLTKLGLTGATDAIVALAGAQVDHWAVREAAVPALCWLGAHLRRDHPLRAWAGDQFNTLRAKSAGWQYSQRTTEGLQRLGLSPTEGPTQVGPWQTTATYGTSALYDQLTLDGSLVDDWVAVREQVSALSPWDPCGLDGYLALLCGDFDPMIADLYCSDDGYGQDPRITAPEVVAEVSKTLGLGADSACYWLQLLALPNPTDRNIDLWNGWTKKQRAAAVEPLVAAELVVIAKRARAGRTAFLPGGWQEASSPHLPMEVWKAPLFELSDRPKVTPKYGFVIALVPLGQLFADAWARYCDGDIPGYTELRTARYRRR